MSLPATEHNRTRNLGIQASTAEKSPPARLLAAKMFCCVPLPRGRGLSRPQRESVWERGRRWLRDPPPPEKHLAFCPKEQKGNTGAPGRARPPLPSHPANTESFPCESGDGFSRGMSASSKPRPMWVTSLWAGCVHTPRGRVGRAGWGESRQRRLPGLTSHPHGVSTHPGAVGGCQSSHASPLTLEAEVRLCRSSSHTGQAQLAGRAD